MSWSYLSMNFNAGIQYLASNDVNYHRDGFNYSFSLYKVLIS
jgi:hypothetical protein